MSAKIVSVGTKATLAIVGDALHAIAAAQNVTFNKGRDDEEQPARQHVRAKSRERGSIVRFVHPIWMETLTFDLGRRTRPQTEVRKIETLHFSLYLTELLIIK